MTGGVSLKETVSEMNLEDKDEQVDEKTCLHYPVPVAGRRRATPTPQH